MAQFRRERAELAEDRQRRNRALVEQNRIRFEREVRLDDDIAPLDGEFLRLFDDDVGGYNQCFEADRRGRDLNARWVLRPRRGTIFGRG